MVSNLYPPPKDRDPPTDGNLKEKVHDWAQRTTRHFCYLQENLLIQRDNMQKWLKRKISKQLTKRWSSSH